MYRNFSENDAAHMAEALLCWFEEHKRPLPWRKRYLPYEVLISEVMLQQTQMERAVSYFQRWMMRFPDIQAVAHASEEEILQHWEGLGYYRRARYLHQAAKLIAEKHGGNIPDSLAALSELPGLGAYTAAAVLGIAYEQDIVSIDANVERVFSRLLDIDSPIKKQPASSLVKQESARFLPHGKARAFNQALMELGALVCGKAPRCTVCPLIAWCEAHKRGTEKMRPVSAPKKSIIPITGSYGILICKGHTLLLQRPSNGLWGNLWQFPGTLVEKTTPEDALLHYFQELGIKAEIIAPLGKIQHSYTNHKLTAFFFRVMADPAISMSSISALLGSTAHTFVLLDKTEGYAMPAHHRKMADRYFHSPKAAPTQLQF